MADLETTKEDKFEYRTPDDLYVHAEPFSPKVWNERLRKIMGDCPLGEPRLRIVWGGDMKKRGYVQTEKGSVEKMVIKYPAPISKIRKIKGFVYFNDKGQRVLLRSLKIFRKENWLCLKLKNLNSENFVGF